MILNIPVGAVPGLAWIFYGQLLVIPAGETFEIIKALLDLPAQDILTVKSSIRFVKHMFSSARDKK